LALFLERKNLKQFVYLSSFLKTILDWRNRDGDAGTSGAFDCDCAGLLFFPGIGQ
jgi:hypothetical protein